MNILEEVKIRCKYQDELTIWEYDLRQDCYQKLFSAYRNEKINAKNFLDISRVIDVDYDLKEIGEIRRRVSTKSKINMR
jgi:hypothetical protein